MNNVGYARVSTDDQTLALQLDALQAAGCDIVHEDRLSGAAAGILIPARFSEPEAIRSIAPLLGIGEFDWQVGEVRAM